MKTKEELIKELKAIRSESADSSPSLLGSIGRGIAKAPGSIIDIGLIPYNVYAAFANAPGFSVAEESAKLYDKATDNKYKPKDFSQKASENVAEFVGSGAGLSKLLTKGTSKAAKVASKYLAPKTAQDYAALATAGVGAAAGEQISPENPGIGSLVGGLAGGTVPGASRAIGAGVRNMFGPSIDETFKGAVGLKEIPKKGELARTAVEKLQDKAAKEKAPITAKYQKAKDEAGDIAISEIKAFPTFARQILNAEGYINENNIGKLAHGYVKSFNSMFANTKGVDNVTGVNRNALEKWRQGINQSIRNLEKTNPNNQEIGALNRLKEIAREWETDLTRRGLSSNPKSLANYDVANKEYAQWASKYKDKSNAGKKFIYNIIKTPKENLIPENIADQMLGKANTSFKKDTPFIVRELDKLIPEEMNLVRQEAAIKMFRPLLENDTEKTSKYLYKYLQDHNTTLEALYGKQGVKEIAKKAKEWQANPDPNSIINFISKQPWGGKIISTILRTQENILSATPTIANSLGKNEQELEQPTNSVDSLIEELRMLRSKQ